MPMQDVKSARDLDDLKRRIFVNFHEIEKKLNTVNDTVVDFTTGDAPSTKSGASGTPISTVGTIYIGDGNTWITRNSSGDMVFRDANAGEVTLTQIKLIAALFWSYGSAQGIKMRNSAHTELMIGITEDADGLTIFNTTDEVE